MKNKKTKRSFGRYITEEYGKSYLASVILLGAVCYQRKKDGKKFSVKKILEDLIYIHKLKLTKKGEKLVRQTVIKTLRDMKVKGVLN